MSSSSVAAGHGRAATSTHGRSASGVGGGLGPASQPGSFGYWRGCSRGHGTVMVTVGGGGGTPGSPLSAGALGLSSVVSAHGDAMQLDDNDDDYNDYDNDASSAGDDKDDLEGASAPPEDDAKLRKNCLLRGVIRTNNNYGPSVFVQLLDPSPEALAVYGAVELQAPTFFTSHSVVLASGHYEEDPPICARCLWWNFVAPLLKCNRDGWTGCGCRLYVQHAQCRNKGPRPFPDIV
jgi:hypothetical protein